jgi:hypothetical protein
MRSTVEQKGTAQNNVCNLSLCIDSIIDIWWKAESLLKEKKNFAVSFITVQMHSSYTMQSLK